MNRRTLASASLALGLAAAGAAAQPPAEPAPAGEATATPAPSVPRWQPPTAPAAPRPLAAPADDACEVTMVRAPRPKIAFLNFFWHRPEEFACSRLVPREGPIDSDDTGWNGYYHRRFQRLKSRGVDVLGFVWNGFGSRDRDIRGRVPHTVREGANLEASIWLARDVGLPFFIYYDLNVRTAVRSRRCLAPPGAGRDFRCRRSDQRPVEAYDLSKRVLYKQLRQDLLRIKNDYILPHRDDYYMLEDASGRPVLDEAGLPRPVIALYIARKLAPNRAIERLVREVTRRYRSDGLGQPAFVLDAIFWHQPVPGEIVERFGSSAAALTSFFPVNHLTAEALGVDRMRQWTPHMAELYEAAALEIEESEPLHHLQIWPGLGAMFDNRRAERNGCEPLPGDGFTPEMRFHLGRAGDWRQMLRMAYDSAYVPVAECSDEPADFGGAVATAGAAGSAGPSGLPRRAGSNEPPDPGLQPLVINYDNEFRESAVTDCVRTTPAGRVKFPYRFGCKLLDVVENEDRWP